MKKEEYVTYEREVQEAVRTYRGTEMREAYERWKRNRGEEPAPMLRSDDKTVVQAHESCKEDAKRPCTQPGCDGVQRLESVCGGCVEGRAGFKSKWTCEKCLHRELSKKEYMEWMQDLAQLQLPLSSKESS